MRNNPSVSKLIHTVLFIIFAILIFLCINPTQVHATSYIENITRYEANEKDEAANKKAGYLYWAAASNRSGVMMYVVDDCAKVRVKVVMLERKGETDFEPKYASRAVDNTHNNIPFKGVVNYKTMLQGSVDDERTAINNVWVRYIDDITPTYYDDSKGWQARGSSVMDYLLSPSETDVEIKVDVRGTKKTITLPVWADYVIQANKSESQEILTALSRPNTAWKVFLEPVSVNYLYSNETFSETKYEFWNSNVEHKTGDPVPRHLTCNGKVVPYVYLTTATNMMSESASVTGRSTGGDYTYKYYHMQLPISMCLKDDDKFIALGNRELKIKAPTTSQVQGKRLSFSSTNSPSQEYIRTGIGIASITVSLLGDSKIHTYDGHNTPGPTEDPEPDKTGVCTIKKLYVKKVGSRYETVTHTYITSEVLFFLLIFRINNISKASIS